VTPRRSAARVTELFLVHRQQQLQQVAVQVRMIECAHGNHQYPLHFPDS
jgi:hypothetical protein